MDITDLIVGIVSTLGLILLLFNALSDRPARKGPVVLRTAPLEQPDDDGSSLVRRRVDDSVRRQRRLWVVQPGAAGVDQVPVEVQAEALKMLDMLRNLDALFADGQHHTLDER